MTPHEVIQDALTLSPVAQASVRRVLDGAARRLLAEQLDPTNTTSRATEPDSSTNSGKALPHAESYSHR